MRTLEAVRKAAAVDAEAARMWVHLGLYEALGDMIDDVRPEVDELYRSVIDKRNRDIRRELVRSFVERRIDGEDVTDITKAAGFLNMVNTVAKAVTPDDPRTPWWDKRKDGRFAPREGADDAANLRGGSIDMLRALTQDDKDLRGRAEGVRNELTSDDRYRHLRVAGNALVATGHPKAQAIGVVTRMAAEVGPSAEDVLGPSLRRVAYRYRGTEKRPDAQLVRQTRQANGMTSLITDGTPEDRARVEGALDRRAPGHLAAGAVGFHSANQDLTSDQLRLRSTSDVSTAYLLSQLPTLEEARLSQEGGRTPPSVGVMIDRDGDVVSEAMGYNGDHYVPFDLRNLKRLHGGAYVRTRALGGPTTEDIYTGLLTGARQIQVVSRSGVFTVEFDPDLRGGRRYSDKARQMIDRYARIVDVVARGTDHKGEPIYTNDISETEKRKIHAEALEQAGFNEKNAEAIEERMLRIARTKASIGYSEEEISDQADAEVAEWAQSQRKAGKTVSRGEIGRQREQVIRELSNKYSEERQVKGVRRLQLNGEGYYRALKSLQREFPYYIRHVDWVSLPDFEETRGLLEPGDKRSPRSAPPAKRTHVGRGQLEPAHQRAAYGRDEKGRRRKEEAPADETTEESGSVATAGGGSKPAKQRGGALTDAVRSENVQRVFRGSVHTVLQAARSAPDNYKSAQADVRDAKDFDEARSLLPVSFIEWVGQKNHWDAERAAKWMSEDAPPEALDLFSEGIDALEQADPGSWTGGNFGQLYSPEVLSQADRITRFIRQARDPFAKVEGDPVLHEPSKSDPRPVQVPGLPNSDNVKDYDDWAANQDDDFLAAKEVGQGKSVSTLAGEIRSAVIEYKDALDFGERRAKADPEDLLDIHSSTSVSTDTADRIYEQKDKSPEYAQLKARQKYFAYVYARHLAEAMGEFGGGATPKAPERKEIAAKRARVQYHPPTDPLSVALAKRMKGSSPLEFGRSRAPRSSRG